MRDACVNSMSIVSATMPEGQQEFKPKYVRHVVAVYIIMHCMALYGLYLFLLYGNWKSFVVAMVCIFISIEAVTMGSHRLYSHKSFKAHWSVRLFLNILQVMAGQNSMYTWVRDHRLHHKYTETDADPHNARRGFFFSHMGWLLMQKHPAVIAAGKKLNLADIKADPYVMWQKRYFLPLFAVISMVIPVAVPMYYWNESFLTAFCFCFMSRYLLTLHITGLINSVAHKFGIKPYDKNIYAAEILLLSMITFGEGWHNYHHTFPADYRTSELGVSYNFTTSVIDLLARLGLAYDLRTMPDHLVKQRMKKTGDGHCYKLIRPDGFAEKQ